MHPLSVMTLIWGGVVLSKDKKWGVDILLQIGLFKVTLCKSTGSISMTPEHQALPPVVALRAAIISFVCTGDFLIKLHVVP